MPVVPLPKLVVLGMMSKMPVAGVVWQNIHYLVGFQRLGYDVYYVEAHARTPSMFVQGEGDTGSERAAGWIARIMRRFDLDGHWAFHALHADSQSYGMSERELADLYQSAALIVNLHGGTEPRPEHAATGRLIYLETDPVALQIELARNQQRTLDFLEPHCAFFTFGENYGRADCRLPVSSRFTFHPTRQPVVVEFWQPWGTGAADVITTIANWKQPWHDVTFGGEIYHWSKHFEFLKFIDLPNRTNQPIELTLSNLTPDDAHLLRSNGWRVRDALEVSTDLDAYRAYILQSRAEFTVAKDQNIRLRSGWFSDRSATYLAAGRPVVTQETGFSNVLPTGQGLFAFSTISEAVAAIEEINADYERHRRAALKVAQDHFSHAVVLNRLLDVVGR